ncbi:UvrD-helicase domain-containing protein [Metallumcola ferriviriculae]|uniref:UvrD-helicase domain-containing protein n=1 Tax=Metallumcola ferriviriculae TaxID=3039180 RepID=A0AAU0ULI5_9FIRM|nr:UvrD-helicase domain-containing protein [Desulfitibacteraceae bacterium MK1]
MLDVSKENLSKVIHAKDKPYFSRIDFQETGSNESKKYYIGKLSLLKENNEPLIIDWRAPIASTYYDGRLGEVSYQTDTGTVSGELSLKRQFTIEEGKLLDFFDVDITTNDEFLQSHLGAHADNRLKDIVSTIQAEQNKIIRADLEQPLIVQGAAGSGKTTIALHRIAYLIYTYEENFVPENFMIIAPNSLFLNYISGVLPELGVERVQQTTFTKFCRRLLGEKYKLLSPEEKLGFLLKTDADEAERVQVKRLSKFKGSMQFKVVIDKYLNKIEKDMLPNTDFLLEEYLIVSREEVKRLFLVENGHLPLHRRLDQLKQNLSVKLKNRKEELHDQLHNEYQPRINAIRKRMAEVKEEFEEQSELMAEEQSEEQSEEGERVLSEQLEKLRLQLVALMDERDGKLASIDKTAKTVVRKYLARFEKKDALHYYKQLLTKKELLLSLAGDYLSEDHIHYILDTAKGTAKKSTFEIEDLPALLYLKARVEGFAEELTINNVVIDEAQDFSIFQFFVLRYILSTTNFTILGDLSQGIYSYRGVDDWQEVQDQVFPDGCSYLMLRQSYRTTIEIMNLANRVIEAGTQGRAVLAEPVVRHGQKPTIQRYDAEDDLVNELAVKITELKRENYSSIALIVKTMDECERIKNLLTEQGFDNITLLTGDDESYAGGLVLVPAYLAKGLEFDAVVVAALNERFENNDFNAKLLYVAMTRAMHRLDVYYLAGTMPLLEESGVI